MEIIGSITGWIADNIPQLLQVVGAFSIVAMWTPNSADNKIVKIMLDIINFLGGNLGKAENK